MPNWVYNTIYTDNPEVIKALLNKDNCVDFNNLIPMPESLNVVSGSVTEEAIYYYISNRLEDDVTNEDLIRLNINKLYFCSVNDIKDRVVHTLKQMEMRYPFSTSCNMNNENDLFNLGKQYVQNYYRYGYTTWYDWCCKYWGTKWNACDTRDLSDTEVKFDTAWDAPRPVLEKLCNMFPNEDIEIWSENEDGHWDKFRNKNGKLFLFSTGENFFDEDDE